MFKLLLLYHKIRNGITEIRRYRWWRCRRLWIRSWTRRNRNNRQRRRWYNRCLKTDRRSLLPRGIRPSARRESWWRRTSSLSRRTDWCWLLKSSWVWHLYRPAQCLSATYLFSVQAEHRRLKGRQSVSVINLSKHFTSKNFYYVLLSVVLLKHWACSQQYNSLYLFDVGT